MHAVNRDTDCIHFHSSPSLASSVLTPLFTKQSIDLMNRKLSRKEKTLWNKLGANWFLTRCDSNLQEKTTIFSEMLNTQLH